MEEKKEKKKYKPSKKNQRGLNEEDIIYLNNLKEKLSPNEEQINLEDLKKSDKFFLIIENHFYRFLVEEVSDFPAELSLLSCIDDKYISPFQICKNPDLERLYEEHDNKEMIHAEEYNFDIFNDLLTVIEDKKFKRKLKKINENTQFVDGLFINPTVSQQRCKLTWYRDKEDTLHVRILVMRNIELYNTTDVFVTQDFNYLVYYLFKRHLETKSRDENFCIRRFSKMYDIHMLRAIRPHEIFHNNQNYLMPFVPPMDILFSLLPEFNIENVHQYIIYALKDNQRKEETRIIWEIKRSIRKRAERIEKKMKKMIAFKVRRNEDFD